MTEKFVYKFATNESEGDGTMKNLLGGKGANLAEMGRLGIPIPPGFTITTDVCTYFYKNGNRYPEGLQAQVEDGIRFLESKMGAVFGSAENPLLLSVRSGARVSMPGMMDTVLNLGLNDAAVQGLIRQTGNPRFAYDAYRRFIQMYGDVVMQVRPAQETQRDPFDSAMEDLKKERGVKLDIELSWEDLRELVERFKRIVRERTGRLFPQDPLEQLWGAIGAVFGSWMNERAKVYREMNRIPDDWGTAVNVQCMVFGNMGEDCATGVGFTRDSRTGEKRCNGEYLVNAQGEDVVAGIRNALEITLADSRERAREKGMTEEERLKTAISLEELMPAVFKQLMEIFEKLEVHYRDMQDVEFTIQKGKLYMLQTRAAKRTGYAALRIAVDMAEEGLISPREAIMRVSPDNLEQVLKPIFNPEEKKRAVKEKRVLGYGLPAGPGAATGRVVFTGEAAQRLAKEWNAPVILVRHETSPEDIKGMRAAQGILTEKGGMTSHAALVGRQMGKVCVVGCAQLDIDYASSCFRIGGRTVKEGDWIALDGFTGEVIEGEVATVESEVTKAVLEGRAPRDRNDIYYHYVKLMEWADQFKKLAVRTNADDPEAAQYARRLGASGIGLTRTEHMFFTGDRIWVMREMIMAETKEQRESALAKLLPMQKEDFKGIFRAMDGCPVTIRTLDPPLHEFLPQTEEQLAEMAGKLNVSVNRVKQKVRQLKEINPMLGHRGCRLGIVYPEITRMQTRAIIEAAIEVEEEGCKVLPEIMVPLVSHVNELAAQRKVIDEVAQAVFKERGRKVEYMVGTMIELPRAAVTADEIARVAEFFSFGTNDLTQTTFGISRDDAGSYLGFYKEQKILNADPFATLDTEGVGELVRIAVEKGRKTRPKIKLGICGEHGGDPDSVHFCHKLGLDYVSCSPPRVTIARLAAAQAAIQSPAL